MPYNGSGSFNLSDTIANATPNDADEVMAILTDLAAGLTGSVAKDGQSTMTGPLKAANGSAAAPSYTWGSDSNMGFYRYASGKVGVAIGGVAVGYLDATGWHGDVVGNVTGDVTGNLTGNVTGNLTGAVTGTASGNPPNARTITAGTGLSGGGDLSANRTLSLATSGVSAGVYVAPRSITIDAYGRITSATAGAGGIVARATVTVSGTTPTVKSGSSSNVASVTRQSGPVYRVTLSNAQASTSYQVLVNGYSSASGFGFIASCIESTKTTTVFDLGFTVHGSSALTDPTSFDFIVVNG